MNIQEIEKATGLPRANIRYYEKEGLLNPERGKNGYRNYSEEDRDTLLKILLLRNLGVSLAEIRALQEGKTSLKKVLATRSRQAEEEIWELQEAREICGEICSLGIDYEDLDAAGFLAAWGEKRAGKAEQDRLTGEIHPWYRLFARGIDFTLYRMLWMAFQTFFLRWYPVGGGSYDAWAAIGGAVWGAVISMLLCLVLEPLLLARWGTTPGKWVFGIRVQKEGGDRLTYREGIDRTWEVLCRGLGFQIPIFGWVREWDQYKAYQEQGYVEWDRGIAYTFRGRKSWQCVILYILIGLIAGQASTLMDRQAALPKNRGDLTIAEFAENYNGFKGYYENYYMTFNESEAALNEKGEWVTAFRLFGIVINTGTQNVQYLNDRGDMLPVLTYEADSEGNLERITAEATWDDKTGGGSFNFLEFPAPLMAAFMGAQKEVNAWNGKLEEILKFGRGCYSVTDAELTVGGITAVFCMEREPSPNDEWPYTNQVYHWVLTMTKEKSPE